MLGKRQEKQLRKLVARRALAAAESNRLVAELVRAGVRRGYARQWAAAGRPRLAMVRDVVVWARHLRPRRGPDGGGKPHSRV